jgi:HEAT repeat protein
VLSCVALSAVSSQQSNSDLTSRQREIEKQRRRLSSSDEEERRDAVMRLGSMKHPDGSRVAATALNDPSAIIRATAASALLSLPSEESAALLLPLLNDKKEFVRQQVAYALGETHSPSAVEGLVTALERDKLPSVRGAAAVALGIIADLSASSYLSRTIDPGFSVTARFNLKGRSKVEKDTFVLRAVARSLGQMRSRASVPVLIAAMTNKNSSDDLRREAALSLGLIGDDAAVTALRAAQESRDPYLARIAFESLLKISRNISNLPD